MRHLVLLVIVSLALLTGLSGVASSSGLGHPRRANISVGGNAMAAYMRDEGGSAFWIAVADLAGNGRRVITPHPSKPERRSDYRPVWSPDGSQLAFMRVGRDPGLYVTNRDGSGLRRVLRVGQGTGADHAFGAIDSPSWSPDGRRLAYGYGPLYVVNSDGTASRRLLASSTCNPVWSPDGKSLLYTADAAPCQPDGGMTAAPGYRSIYRIDATGAHRRRLANGSFGEAVWSPNGKQIAYEGNCGVQHGGDFSCRLFLMNADGSGKRLLAKHTFGRGSGDIRWADDGKEVIWPNGHPTYGMSATDLSTGQTHNLVPAAAHMGGVYVAGISRDGQTIALSAWGEKTRTVVVSATGRLIQRVTVPRGWNYNRLVSIYLP